MKAIEIAEYIITKGTALKTPCNNYLLNRILFEIQKEGAKELQSFIIDEKFEAWKIGPICPEIYYRYCGFGASPILLSYDDKNFCPENSKARFIIEKVSTQLLKKGNEDLLFPMRDLPPEWQLSYKEGHQNPIYFV